MHFGSTVHFIFIQMCLAAQWGENRAKNLLNANQVDHFTIHKTSVTHCSSGDTSHVILWPTFAPNNLAGTTAVFYIIFHGWLFFWTKSWRSFQDVGVRQSKFASRFSNCAVIVPSNEEAPLLTEHLQAEPASFPPDKTTDLYGTMSDHALFLES